MNLLDHINTTQWERHWEMNPAQLSWERLFNHNVAIFEFEKNWNESVFRQWMTTNWTQTLIYSIAYMLFIFGGQHYMNQKASGFSLRGLLAIWSSVLAVFSIIGSIRTVPSIITDMTENGFEFTVCAEPPKYNRVLAFWCFMFVASKAYELIDTIFIILRKQNLIFLHWYHHITVMIYTWYSYKEDSGVGGRWFYVINYVVHAFMYSYYALRAMKFRPPKFISVSITTMQISQMMLGIYLLVYASYVKMAGRHCNISYLLIWTGLAMYISYFILFARFFYLAYVKRGKSEKKTQ